MTGELRNGELLITKPVAAISGLILGAIIIGSGGMLWRMNNAVIAQTEQLTYVRSDIAEMKQAVRGSYTRDDAARDWSTQAGVNNRLSSDLRDIDERMRLLERVVPMPSRP